MPRASASAQSCVEGFASSECLAARLRFRPCGPDAGDLESSAQRGDRRCADPGRINGWIPLTHLELTPDATIVRAEAEIGPANPAQTMAR